MDFGDLQITLPSINGEFLTGIAANTEVALHDDKRLKFVHQTDKGVALSSDQAIKATLALTLRRLRETNIPEGQQPMYIVGAYACMHFGFLCTSTNADRSVSADGDWDFVTTAELKQEDLNADNGKFITNCLRVEDVRKVSTVIVATKVNWWKENHHTGQNRDDSGNFTKKVLNAMYGDGSAGALLDAAHTMGHWASTRAMMTLFGIKGVIATNKVLAAKGTITLTDDIKMRIKACPAGTGRMNIAYELFKKMIRHPLSVCCPALSDFAVLPAVRSRVKENPGAYHIGAHYLCGASADYSDSDYGGLLGRTGAWAHTFFARTTLLRSPHAVSYKNASDYDPDWETSCTTFKAKRAKMLTERMEVFNKVGMSAGTGYDNICRAFGERPNEEVMELLRIIKDGEAGKDQPNPVANVPDTSKADSASVSATGKGNVTAAEEQAAGVSQPKKAGDELFPEW